MPDLLQTANAWLQKVRHDKFAVLVNYRRGGVSISILATVGRTVWVSETAGGVRLSVESRDYLIRVSDLIWTAIPRQPMRGDLIEGAPAVGLNKYEVMPFGPLNEEWRYSDPYELTFRVHTKLLVTV